MTIGELLDKYPEKWDLQINVITPEKTVLIIPNPAHYQENRHFARLQEIGALPVTSLSLSLEAEGDTPILLLVINENSEEQEMMYQ